MASTTIPVEVALPPFHRGAAFNFKIGPLTVDADLPDPNTWTACRLSIIPPTGDPVTIPLASMTPTITPASGPGPWTVTLIVPITRAQTLSLVAGRATWQLDFTVAAATSQDILMRGDTQVLAPKKAMP